MHIRLVVFAGLATAALFFHHESQSASSGDAARIAATSPIFLRITGDPGSASLIHALEGTGTPSDLAFVASLYRSRHAQGLTIQNVLKAKTDPRAVAAAMGAFEIEKLRFADLLPLFAWLDLHSEIAMVTREALLREFGRVRLEPVQLAALLELGSASARKYAILRAQDLHEESLITEIRARLDHLDPYERDLALQAIGRPDRSVASKPSEK